MRSTLRFARCERIQHFLVTSARLLYWRRHRPAATVAVSFDEIAEMRIASSPIGVSIEWLLCDLRSANLVFRPISI